MYWIQPGASTQDFRQAVKAKGMSLWMLYYISCKPWFDGIYLQVAVMCFYLDTSPEINLESLCAFKYKQRKYIETK